jgi:hypothetical protein
MKIASEKPYSPSPGIGSLRTMVLETCSPDRRCMLMNEDIDALVARGCSMFYFHSGCTYL